MTPEELQAKIEQLSQEKKDLEERVTALETFNVSQTPEFQQDVFDQVLLMLEQGNGLGIGARLAANSAALIEVTSYNKGVRFPRMTTTQRDAITNPGAGLLIFNTTTGVYNFHNGSAWAAI